MKINVSQIFTIAIGAIIGGVAMELFVRPLIVRLRG